MSKYNNRYEYTLLTANQAKQNEDDWLNELDKNLNKQAVQSRTTDQSMFEQINNIINGKSKHRNVQDAVEDMQRRSGYLEYITKKVAQEISGKQDKPTLFAENPDIEITINNYVSDTKGNLDVPSIIEHVKGIHKSDVQDQSLWDEEKLVRFVHELNEKSKQNTTPATNYNLGKLDLQKGNEGADKANDDAWAGLMPATK